MQKAVSEVARYFSTAIISGRGRDKVLSVFTKKYFQKRYSLKSTSKFHNQRFVKQVVMHLISPLL